VNEFLERLVDEDNRYEHSEALLSEACYVADERAQIKHDDKHEEQTHPHADPETKAQVI